MLPKWDTLISILGCVTMVTAIYGVAQHSAFFLGTRAEPARLTVSAFGGSGGGLMGSGPRVRAPRPVREADTLRDDFFLSLVSDDAILTHGREQYAMFCAACHGVGNLGGDSPSNLFNNRWVHGGNPANIEALIREGYLDGGMPGFDGMLPDETIEAMVAYIIAFQE
ncbi:MAG: cytochrome c [Opitutales bacterium]|nr:cytochrome c [Opitutales bacterium]